MLNPKINTLSEKTHEVILLHLKKNGEMAVSDLCDRLGITAMAVRRHLMALQQNNLVESKLVKQGRGRPRYVYHLTKKANDLFPSGFQSLATDFLDIIREEQGHKGVMEFLSKRYDRVAQRLAERMKNKDLSERVAEVAQIFTEEGYMAEWIKLPDGNFMLYQRNCALHDLANQYRQVCVLEPKLIETLLGAKVTRQQYMLKNDSVCGYLIQQEA